jgi:phage shock protein C
MYCTQCGTKLADTARYCTACGKPAGPAPQRDVPVGDSIPIDDAPRRLRRIREGKKIAGVCAGFAEYFGVDVTIMRVIWIGLTVLPPHLGLIGYIVAWAVLPKP